MTGRARMPEKMRTFARWSFGPQPELRIIVVLLVVLIVMSFQILRAVKHTGRDVEYAITEIPQPTTCGEAGDPCHVNVDPQ